MNPGSVLEVQGVTVRFGGLTALDSVSLAVPPRHVLGVIGPNGAGKTTLLNVLCGFIRPDAGEVLFGGRRHNVRPHRLAGLGVARTLQGVGLYAGLTALENVMVGATCRASAGFWSALLSLPRATRDERQLREQAVAALERVGAAQVAQARPGELSYGMRKRVALARALVVKPGLVLLDEPASGLDESELAELGGLIRDLATEGSLVVVEHHMDLMMSVCDSLVVLDFGKVIATGTPRQVQDNPAVTAAYLGAAGDQAPPAARRYPPMSSAAAQQDESPALAVDGLVAGYGGVIALDGVSISAGTAAITAVLGANGAGKTTLLRAISGMIKPRRGRVLLGGADLAGRSPEQIVRAGIAHVPEGQGVIPELTVEENLRVGMMSWPGALSRASGSPSRHSRAERAAALDEAYERFRPLAERRRKLAATLSGGERQMLVIARALLARPRVLLLDEPSLGLAPRVMAQVMDLVVRLSREHGITIILVEQNARGALAIADHGVVLNLGRVVASADAATLAADVALRHHYLGF